MALKATPTRPVLAALEHSFITPPRARSISTAGLRRQRTGQSGCQTRQDRENLATKIHRPFRIQACRRGFASTPARQADFTHAVIGAGAVGLAIARRLQQREGASTILIEKHGSVGTETSSRNSEVIHAGLYYGTDTLKARLCVRGKEMLYALCEAKSIPHARPGKLIVAQTDNEREALESLHSTARALSIPTEFLSASQVSSLEPLIRAERGALLSPTTGILDSHTYMTFLESAFTDSGGDTALHSSLDSATYSPATSEWALCVTSPSTREPTTITASTLINSAGLHAIPLSNTLLPPLRHITPHYAKGTYWTYARRAPASHLVYPAPVAGHGGLGTHLTLDLTGRARFGPDVQWTQDPGDYTPQDDPERFSRAMEQIRAYLPGVKDEDVQVDYCGIRPKLKGEGEGQADFYIKREEGFSGSLINLLGIESPGLTGSLAIGDEVWDLLYG